MPEPQESDEQQPADGHEPDIAVPSESRSTAEIEEELDQYSAAMGTVEATLAKIRSCTDKEKSALREDVKQLGQMYQKLSRGRVDIVIFGEISTGKSAMINALVGQAVAAVDVQGGWTKEIWGTSWEGTGHRIPGLDESEIVLIDTPGINEVGGSDRGELATEAARKADLILFVTDSDLNETEYAALYQLASLQKPIILVLNKMDLYNPEQRTRLTEVLEERVGDWIPRDQIVTTTADPREVECIIEKPDGSTHSEWRRPAPRVEDLKLKIMEILDRDGLDLIALNAALYAADKSDRVASLRVELRDRHATQLIMTYATIKAIAVAANPVPFGDTLGGVAVDVTMVMMLAKVYGLEMSSAKAKELSTAIAKSAGWVGAGELIGPLVKLFTLSAATPLIILPQGAAAGYSSYIVGHAAKYYFEHGASWGSQGPKKVVKDILSSTDRSSVVSHLKKEIQSKLWTNRHANSG
ncbi:MAG: GTP-binding protein [Planctomycetota bacterium]|nr:GTP-binding protein [Planctomycetota bacterium]